MAISQNEILYGQYYANQSISSKEFEDFLKELLSRVSKEYIKKYLFILNNAKNHSTVLIKNLFMKIN